MANLSTTSVMKPVSQNPRLRRTGCFWRSSKETATKHGLPRRIHGMFLQRSGLGKRQLSLEQDIRLLDILNTDLRRPIARFGRRSLAPICSVR